MKKRTIIVFSVLSTLWMVSTLVPEACAHDCVPPEASFTGPSSVYCGDQAIFTCTSTDADSVISSRSWIASRGTPSTGSVSTFTTKWCTAGSKTVSLTVWDSDAGVGCPPNKSDTEQKNVTVLPVNVVAISFISGKDVACTGETLSFAAITNPLYKYGCVEWSGGGTPPTETGEDFETYWSTTGTKTLTASACGSSMSVDVEIIEGLTVLPNEAYVPVNGTKEFKAWTCVDGVATDATDSATFEAKSGAGTFGSGEDNNKLTAGDSPSEFEGEDWVKASHGVEGPTDGAHDCDLTVFEVEITTPTSTAMDITTDPEMPSVTFHADIEPEDILSEATFKWYLDMTFTHDTLGALEHRVPTSETDDVEGSEDWTPSWGDLLAGGSVSVYVAASVDGSDEDEDDQDGYQIRGTNPTQSQIFGIADLRARAVCWKESSHRQFNATTYTGVGMPLASFGEDGGYGLMQPTPASESQTWEWDTNLNAGIDHLDEEYERSVQHVSNINTPGIAPNPDPEPDPELTMTTAQHWMNALSRYRAGTYYYGYELVSGTEYQWVRNSGTGPDYADDIVDFMDDPPW